MSLLSADWKDQFEIADFNRCLIETSEAIIEILHKIRDYKHAHMLLDKKTIVPYIDQTFTKRWKK